MSPLDARPRRAYAHGMRLAVLIAVTMAACSSDDVATGLDGEWRLTWECVSTCDQDPIALLEADALVVDEGTITWNTSPPSVLTGARSGDCIAVPDGTRLPHPQDVGLAVYDLDVCASNGAVDAELYVIGQAGQLQERWAMAGTRR